MELTRLTSTQDLQYLVNDGYISLWSIVNLPYNNQAVEGKVKLVKEASAVCCYANAIIQFALHEEHIEHVQTQITVQKS